MRAIVLGSGIMGLTTSYMLSKIGYKVTVLEKNSASGLGCSYANGGQLSFSHAEPWFSRSSLFSILKNAISPKSFVHVQNLADKEFLKWLLQFISNCSNKKVSQATINLLNLGMYSKFILENILKEEKIDFKYNKNGILHFYRSKKSFEKAKKQADFQAKLGCKFDILNSKQCLDKESTLIKLSDQDKLAGGILFKDDASGDSSLFINGLEKVCKEKYNVEFIYNCQVQNILTNRKKITGVNSSKGVFQGDIYVNTLGSYGNLLLKGVGVNNNIYPVKGYSLSIPVNKSYLAPKISITDSENKIVYSRLGSIFRAAGTIEICNLKSNNNIKNINFLKNIIKSTYSDFGNMVEAKEWFGFRPYCSNGVPIVGKVKKYGNLYNNYGHGSLGWTNSFASAKIISDKILYKSIDKRFSFLGDI